MAHAAIPTAEQASGFLIVTRAPIRSAWRPGTHSWSRSSGAQAVV